MGHMVLSKRVGRLVPSVRRSQTEKDILVALVVNLVFVFFMTTLVCARDVPREPLDRLWEEHMLAGTHGSYLNGKRDLYVPERSFESAKGSPSGASFTKEGIKVEDLQETRLLGLWQRGGWMLHGGLLAKISEGRSAVELYGKTILRSEPVSLFVGLINPHADYTREYGDEFFLLYRKKGVTQATVVRKWTFNQDEIQFFDVGSMADVKGYLQYDPATKIATIIITGLKRPFEERVDLSSEVESSPR